MEPGRNVVDGLLKISELRGAIRHQRSANRRTYLQLMELQAEFKTSKYLLHGNDIRRRYKIVKKFGGAVIKFSRYLQKYDRMYRITRIFKYSGMEYERQEIVDEIEQVFKMLKLATSITASENENASKLLTKLDESHGDIKLTHDQIQAELRAFMEERNNDTPLTKRTSIIILKKHSAAKDRSQYPELQHCGFDGVDQTVRQSTPLLGCTSVSQLIHMLNSAQTTTQQSEMALLLLISECATSSNRAQVYTTGGIAVLERLVLKGGSFFTQLYALHCLSWFTFFYFMVEEAEFEELRSYVRETTQAEFLCLLDELENGDAKVKEAAAIRCSCLATRGEGDTLRSAGVIPLLVHMIAEGTGNQKLWAVETLVTLASESDKSCIVITRAGGIPPLVKLLRSGTNMQKQEAAYALGSLAASSDKNRGKIAREGAIPPMVALMQATTDVQTQWAVYALGFLSLNHEKNRILIAQEGAIPPLVAMLRGGTNPQKQWAAYTLGNLAINYKNRISIKLERVIPPLVTLIQVGNEMEKQRAIYAVGKLASSGDEVDVTADLDKAVLPLVELVRTGSSSLKKAAAITLEKLAANDDNQPEIVRDGVVAPLVELLQFGTGKQKVWSAYAIGRLAKNDNSCTAIVQGGAVELLLAPAETGTKKQKAQATRALSFLSRRMTPTYFAPTNSSLVLSDRPSTSSTRTDM